MFSEFDLNKSVSSRCPFNKSMIAATIGILLSTGPGISSAALSNGVSLSITLGDGSCAAGGTWPACNYGANVVTSGSFFTMDGNFGALLEGDTGIVLGTTQNFSGTAPSLGNPYIGDGTNITQPWLFFGNTGTNFSASAINANSDTQLDMSGWRVAWGEVPSIDMGSGGTATISCGTCLDGDAYTLDYSSVVPPGDPSGFGGVTYAMRLEGTLSFPGAPPITATDSAATIVGNTINVDVLANDSSADGLDATSVTIATQASPGNATANAINGTVDYDPQTATAGSNDSFQYTVNSLIGATSAATDVNVSIQANIAPAANDDTLASSTAVLDNAAGSLVVDVLANDTDANNVQTLPGGIDPGTVTITGQSGLTAGSCSANANGTITYSQTPPSVADMGSCTYTVMDIDSSATAALTSNTGTLNITISGIQSDWDSNLDMSAIIPVLVFDAGIPDASGNSALPPQSGTYFSMDVSQSTTIFTTLTPGDGGGMVIGHDQIAVNSHTSLPNGTETTSIDMPWAFFGNTGMTFSKNGGIVSNPNLAGTLQFSGDPAVNGGQGRYQITWNGIPEIDLGGSSNFPADLGFATINCSATAPVNPADTNLCADGDAFELLYDAHVPLGDPSGFGGVQYGLRMTGMVRFMDSALQVDNGTISVETRSSATLLANPDAGMVAQCIGDCFDYTITGVTNPSVSVVLPLAGAVPNSYLDGAGNTVGPVMRVFNGTWGDFDTSGGDSVESAAAVAGGSGMTCPAPGNAAYGPLTAGHQCMQVTIADDGPNDKAMGLGTITDPNGIGLPVGAAFVDNRTSGSGGCSISATPADPAKGGAWWLLTGLLGWMGWRRRRS